MIEVLSLDEVCKPALANLLVEEALFSLEVIVTFVRVREELARRFDYLFEFAQAVTRLDLLHRLKLECLDFLAER